MFFNSSVNLFFILMKMFKIFLEDYKEYFMKWIDLYFCCSSIISFIILCIFIDVIYFFLYSIDLSFFEKLLYILGCLYIFLLNFFESFYIFFMIMFFFYIYKNIINFVKLNCNVDISWFFVFLCINNIKFEIV